VLINIQYIIISLRLDRYIYITHSSKPDCHYYVIIFMFVLTRYLYSY